MLKCKQQKLKVLAVVTKSSHIYVLFHCIYKRIVIYLFHNKQEGGMVMLKTAIEMEKAAVILKLLGDKTRLTMMKLMDDHACCVCEFVEIFQMSQPAISQHLRKLKDLGLVEEERKGQWIFFSVNKNNEYYSFIKDILDQLPSQNDKIKELEEKGTRISCC